MAAALGHAAPEQVDDVEAAYVASGSMVPDFAGDAREHGERLLARIGNSPSDRQRAALAHIAIDRAIHGSDRGSVLEVANAYFGVGALAGDLFDERPTWPLLIGALLFVDELERAIEICDAAVATCHGQDATFRAAANYCRA